MPTEAYARRVPHVTEKGYIKTFNVVGLKYTTLSQWISLKARFRGYTKHKQTQGEIQNVSESQLIGEMISAYLI